MDKPQAAPDQELRRLAQDLVDKYRAMLDEFPLPMRREIPNELHFPMEILAAHLSTASEAGGEHCSHYTQIARRGDMVVEVHASEMATLEWAVRAIEGRLEPVPSLKEQVGALRALITLEWKLSEPPPHGSIGDDTDELIREHAAAVDAARACGALEPNDV